MSQAEVTTRRETAGAGAGVGIGGVDDVGASTLGAAEVAGLTRALKSRASLPTRWLAVRVARALSTYGGS